MKKILLLMLIFPATLLGQGSFKGVKNPGAKRAKKCRKYYEIQHKLPVDLRYGVEVQNRQIIFYLKSKKVFDKLFSKKRDGLAIDIVSRDQFDCINGFQTTNSWAYKGEMLTPLFRKDLEERTLVTEDDFLIINMGELPPHFEAQEIECNLIVLKKKFHCDYRVFSNIDYNQWELLEMGLYRDSVSSQANEEFKLTKKLSFEIPFEKNLHLYAPDELRPLYDSLHLSDYYIKAIKIKAYSSVEGGLENNIRLQNARAESIVQGLQAYQTPEILFEISAAENWDKFYSDIKNSPYAYLSKLPKKKIKEELEKLHETDEMESILAKHRKGVIELELERKIQLTNSSNFTEVFGQAIRNDKIQDAMYVQNYVFTQVKNNKLPEDLIGKLEIPTIAIYNPLITNRIIFEYENSLGSIESHIQTFEELIELLPSNPQVQYNLAALKIRGTNKYAFEKSRHDILKLIKAIEWKMDKKLVNRLKVNYHILNAEYHDRKLAFRARNKSLRHIYGNYNSLDLSDSERLYLARFLSIYSRFDWAEKILNQRVYDEDADVKIIDYYLRLTINNPKKYRNASYQLLLEHVQEKHTDTFCKLFDSSTQEGYTFQLLEHEALSKMYCASCEN